MTTITLYAAPTKRVKLLEQTFEPGKELLLSLDQMASSSNVSPPYNFTVQNQEGDILNLTKSRLIGPNNLHAEVETQAVAVLQATAKEQGDQLAVLSDRVAVLEPIVESLSIPQIRITARQVMKTAMGSPFAETFSQCNEYHPAMIALASIAGLSSSEIALQMNMLLDRCNNAAAHVTSLKRLDELVERSKPLLTQKIRSQMKWEAFIVDKYEEIKNQLPSQFC